MAKDLISKLDQLGWNNRAEKYQAVFDSVEYFNTIADPHVSIVVISWRYIPEMLENFKSLERQRTTNFELVFVNNGAADEEFKSVLPFVDTYIRLNCNTGAFKARNIGALFAKAPILIFLEDDGIPCENFVSSHLEAFEKYEVISVRGVYKPLNSNNHFNKLAKHYTLGSTTFPRFSDLEGNVSYNKAAFMNVGGWNDDINFGHGGLELSLRLTRQYPDLALQIYSPGPYILHDYAKSEEHINTKFEKQKKSLARLKEIYPEWDEFVASWAPLYNKRYKVKDRSVTATVLFEKGINYISEHLLKPALRPFKFALKKRV